MTESRLWVVILTQDEETNLPACLESLRRLPHRLLVMDSGSSDRTVQIATDAGATVLSHPFESYGAQRNRAQASLPDDAEWVLHMDADERLTDELVSEIETLMVHPQSQDGFFLRQRTVFMGRWIKHGGHYPSYHMRLFRPSKGRCEDRRYDQHFLVDGPTGRLQNDFMDVVATDVLSWTVKHARWADLDAREIMDPTKTAHLVEPRMFGTPIEKKRWLREKVLLRPPLFLRSFLYFIYRYFFRLGILDGKEGLVFHVLQGFWFRFLVDAVVFERERADRSDGIRG